jgi:hypothetical protein
MTAKAKGYSPQDVTARAKCYSPQDNHNEPQDDHQATHDTRERKP